MRVLVWITESGWRACVEHARELPADAEITLLHVTPQDAEQLAEHGPARLLGRRTPRSGAQHGYRATADEEARALLAEAGLLLGRRARLRSARGRVEREVVAAAGGAELLLVARDGEMRLGPRSLARGTRYVVDHSPCTVLLLWPQRPPENLPLPSAPA